MIKNIISVMVGGAIGAVLRYLVGLLCAHWKFTTLPLGTLVVNLAGCFLLGLFMGLGERYTHISSSIYLLLTVGVCGAFTTFSTFTADTFRMLNQGQWLPAISYLTVSVVVGFILFWIGRKLIF